MGQEAERTQMAPRHLLRLHWIQERQIREDRVPRIDMRLVEGHPPGVEKNGRGGRMGVPPRHSGLHLAGRCQRADGIRAGRINRNPDAEDRGIVRDSDRARRHLRLDSLRAQQDHRSFLPDEVLRVRQEGVEGKGDRTQTALHLPVGTGHTGGYPGRTQRGRSGGCGQTLHLPVP